MNYTITKKELLSVVETLLEFWGIPMGHEVNVYTDHKNPEYKNSTASSQRAMRWTVLIKQFDPKFIYIKGVENTVADAVSRLEMKSALPAYKDEQ